MDLIKFSYSPGYSDMRGARHCESLQKNADGAWVVVCSDREHFGAPTVTATYEAKEEDVREFAKFIDKENVRLLAGRRKSDEFLTDYSPWEFTVLLTDDPSGRGKREYYCIGEYKKYSEKDYKLLSKLRDAFRALRGKKLFEISEKDD